MADWLPERLPQDIDAERSLLATLCSPGRDAEAAEFSFTLDENDFVHPAHRSVFTAMAAVVRGNTELNPLTLKDELGRAGDLGRVGGYPGLVELLGAEEVGRPQVLADILRRKRYLRTLIRVGAQTVRRAAEEDGTPMDIARDLSGEIGRMLQGGTRKRKTVHIAEVTSDVVADLVEQMQGKESNGVRVGYSRLDGMTQGFPRGGLIILAARPSIGKTALAINWLHRHCAKRGGCGAFYSLEMSREELVKRMLAAEAKMDLKTIVTHGYNATVIQALGAAQARLDELDFHIDDQANVSVHELVAKMHQQMAATEGRLSLVVVDYLQLIQKPDTGNKNRNEASLVGEITRTLKLAARDLNIPIVLLSQLNREIEKRTSSRPVLSDLKDSGSIEQDADIVAFIHRSIVTKKGTIAGEQAALQADLILAKHRNGPVGEITLEFKPEWTQYLEVTRETGLPTASAPKADPQGVQGNLYE